MCAGVLIICTLLLRKKASKRLPKWTLPGIWRVAVLRLLLPVVFPVENVLFRGKVTKVILSAQRGAKQMGVGEEALETGSPMIRYVWLVWLLGVCLLAVYFTAGYVRMYFQLREAIPFTEYAVNDTVVAEICLKLTDKVRIKYRTGLLFLLLMASSAHRLFCPGRWTFKTGNCCILCFGMKRYI